MVRPVHGNKFYDSWLHHCGHDFTDITLLSKGQEAYLGRGRAFGKVPFDKNNIPVDNLFVLDELAYQRLDPLSCLCLDV